MVETKREAFLRLAQKRTENVLNRIRILSNCANPYAYDYTDEDVRKIFEAIESEIDVAKSRFERYRRREFSLS